MNSERWHRRARATGDLLYGVRPIMEALDAGREIERITVQDGLRGSRNSRRWLDSGASR